MLCILNTLFCFRKRRRQKKRKKQRRWPRQDIVNHFLALCFEDINPKLLNPNHHQFHLEKNLPDTRDLLAKFCWAIALAEKITWIWLT
jgi:hypothetical protein